MFPSINLSLKDIQSSWAGLRPLIHEEGKSASELSRKDEIFVSESELISIAGGKLTGYRKMAERIVDLVCKKYKNKYDKKFKEIETHNIALSGGKFENFKEVLTYKNKIFEKLKSLGFSKIDTDYLVHNYGKQTDVILKKFEELTEINPKIRLAKAELWFCLQYEMVQTPLDFFIRRTGRMYFDIESVRTLKETILNEFTSIFNWDTQIIEKYRKELEIAIANANTFI